MSARAVCDWCGQLVVTGRPGSVGDLLSPRGIASIGVAGVRTGGGGASAHVETFGAEQGGKTLHVVVELDQAHDGHRACVFKALAIALLKELPIEERQVVVEFAYALGGLDRGRAT